MELKVPYSKQFNKHSCFVASAAMILRFYGVKINQKNVYNESKEYDPLRKRRIWGCYDAKLMLALRHTGYRMKEWIDEKNAKVPKEIKNWIIKEYEPLLKKAKKLGLIEVSRNATITLIRQLLEKGTPVMAEVHSNTWFKTNRFPLHETHIVAITGHENGKFVVNDPYLPYMGKKGEGVKVSAGHFRKSWEAPPYARNGLFVLEK